MSRAAANGSGVTLAAPTEATAGEHPHHTRELRLWLRMLTATNLVQAELRSRFRERFATTLPRFDVLAQLDKTPDGLTLGELSRRMMVSNGNVTGLVERLVEDGLIERRRAANDRRSAIVRLTGRGREAFDTMAAEHADWVAELFDGLAADEVDRLMELLGRAKASVQNAHARRTPEE